MAYNALEKHYQYALSELRQKTEQLKKSLFLYLRFTCTRIEGKEKEIIQKILKEKFFLDNILDFELTYINSEIKINPLTISKINELDKKLLKEIQLKNSEYGFFPGIFDFLSFWRVNKNPFFLLNAKFSTQSLFSYLRSDSIEILGINKFNASFNYNSQVQKLKLYPDYTLVYRYKKINFLKYYLNTYGKIMGFLLLSLIIISFGLTLLYLILYRNIKYSLKCEIARQKAENNTINDLLSRTKDDLDLSQLKALNIEQKNKYLKEAVERLGANKAIHFNNILKDADHSKEDSRLLELSSNFHSKKLMKEDCNLVSFLDEILSFYEYVIKSKTLIVNKDYALLKEAIIKVNIAGLKIILTYALDRVFDRVVKNNSITLNLFQVNNQVKIIITDNGFKISLGDIKLNGFFNYISLNDITRDDIEAICKSIGVSISEPENIKSANIVEIIIMLIYQKEAIENAKIIQLFD